MDEKKGTKEEKGTKGNGVHVSESKLTFCWTKGWGIKGDKGVQSSENWQNACGREVEQKGRRLWNNGQK